MENLIILDDTGDSPDYQVLTVESIGDNLYSIVNAKTGEIVENRMTEHDVDTWIADRESRFGPIEMFEVIRLGNDEDLDE